MKRVIPTSFPDDPYLDSPATLGAAIRAARTQAGLRQEDAALSTGVALQTLVDIEAGKAGVSIGKILQVARSLGVSLLVVPNSQRDVARRRLADLTNNPVKADGQVIGWLSVDNDSGLYQFEYSANWLHQEKRSPLSPVLPLYA
jgi:transcriptional regulator with XRE-family HTH domain